MVYLALLLFFVFDYMRPGSYVPGLDALHLNALVPMVAIFGTLFGRAPVSNREFLEETNTKLLAFLLVLLALSTLAATVTVYAFTVTKNVFAYLLIYWVLVRQVNSVARLKGVFMSLTVVHLMIAVLNPAMFTNPDARVGINSGAFLGDGNDFALSVNICVPLCLFLFFESRRKIAKPFWIAVLLALVMAIVMTKSRGGTLALMTIGGYYWLKSSRKVLTATLAAVTVVLVLVAAPSSYFDRMGMMTDTEEGSAQGRILAWKASVGMALQHPFMGVGAGHFPMAYGLAKGERWLTAHSIYFLLLGELGFPGIIFLLTILTSNLMRNRHLLQQLRKRPRDDVATATNLLTATSASLVAFAVGGAFLSAAYYPHLYVLSGVMVAARRVARQALEAREGASDETVAIDVRRHARVIPGVLSPEWRPRPALGTSHYSGHGA
ncbi:MAG: O-antigen ligase family protein [Vicinamibacterales bacterium]